MKTLSCSGPVAVDESWWWCWSAWEPGHTVPWQESHHSEMMALLLKLFTLHSLCSYCRHSWVNVCSDSLKRKYLRTSPQCAECPQVVLRCPFWRGLSFGCHSSTAACSCGALISSAFLQNQYHCPFCFLFFPPVWWFGDKGIVYLTWQV